MSSSKGLGFGQLNPATKASAIYLDQAKLAEDIKFMLKTPLNSVYGYPEYGSNLLYMLYKQGTRATLDLVSSSVYDVLIKFKGVDVLNVTSNFSPDKKYIVIKYDITYNSVRVANELLINMEV